MAAEEGSLAYILDPLDTGCIKAMVHRLVGLVSCGINTLTASTRVRVITRHARRN